MYSVKNWYFYLTEHLDWGNTLQEIDQLKNIDQFLVMFYLNLSKQANTEASVVFNQLKPNVNL